MNKLSKALLENEYPVRQSLIQAPIAPEFEIPIEILANHYHLNEPKKESDILYGFISNLIINSEDVDGRIVDMVNEDFWDLI